MQHSSSALTKTSARATAAMGIEKPMVQAKKKRMSQWATRFTWRSQVSWTTWSLQKHRPARNAPSSSDEPVYLHAGIRSMATRNRDPSTALGRCRWGTRGSTASSSTRGTTRTAKKPTAPMSTTMAAMGTT